MKIQINIDVSGKNCTDQLEDEASKYTITVSLN